MIESGQNGMARGYPWLGLCFFFGCRNLSYDLDYTEEESIARKATVLNISDRATVPVPEQHRMYYLWMRYAEVLDSS